MVEVSAEALVLRRSWKSSDGDQHAHLVTPESAAFAESWARTALLERERELAALRTVIGETADGLSRVVVLEGAAGIGKTRLLEEARRLAAESNLRVLSARGGELEREFGFGVVRQLFEPALAGSDGSALDGSAAAARNVFELADQGARIDQSDDPSFASLHGLYWLTINVAAEAPLVVAIDDLHWCDSPSLRFLAYLVRRLEGLAVLLICTLRASELADFGPLGEITRGPLTVSIHPGALSATAALRLVRARLGESAEPAFSAACHAATGGNPLLLHELLKTLYDEGLSPDAGHVAAVADLGPSVTSRAVLLRLARLPEEAVRLARAAAVLGDDCDLSMVAALAGMDFEEAGPAVATLVRAEILRAGTSLGFVHPLIRATVHNDMSTIERALAHERAARLLSDGGARGERVAAHLLSSPPRSERWIVEALGWLYFGAILSAILRERGDLDGARRVLDGSADPGDHGEATRYWLHSKLELLVAEARFDEALAVANNLAPRLEHVANPIDTPWRSPTAMALYQVGRGEQATALAARELELARRWGAPGTVARALRTLGTIERDAGLDHLRQAADVAARSPARLEHAKALAALGAALRRAGRRSDARGPLRGALELADVLGAQGLAGDVRSELYAAGGRPRRTALGGVAALTASERRVAALAAAGQTNREIAQGLFVTPKTVELHLSNAYRKLGIHSRRELDV